MSERRRGLVAVAGGLLSFAAIMATGQSLGDEANEAFGLPLVWVASFAMVLLWVRTSHRSSWREAATELGLRAPVLRGLCLGLAVSVPLPIGALLFSSAPDPRDVISFATRRPVYFLDLWLAMSIVEEFVFRGLLLGQLVRRVRVPVAAAIALQAAIFAVFHLQVILLEAAPAGAAIRAGLVLALGALFGVLFWASRWNLWLPIGLHASLNLFTLFFLRKDGESVASGLTLALMAVVCAVGAAVSAVLIRVRALQSATLRP